MPYLTPGYGYVPYNNTQYKHTPWRRFSNQFFPKHGRYIHRRMVASERPRRGIDASFGRYTTLSPLSRKPAIYINIAINIVSIVKEIL